MATITFTKGQGTGNDFILVADPDGKLELTTKQIAALCDRRFGVGADGLIRVIRNRSISAGSEILSSEPESEWFMDYYNADGTAAEMCGNGIRVFARYLEEKNLAKIVDGSTLMVGTRSGVKDLTRTAGGFAVDLGRWKLLGEYLVEATGLHVPRPGQGIDLGNPHVVVALASAEELAALRLQDAPLVSPEPVAGANVEFVVPDDPMVVGGVGQFSMRVHERGVGETLSCGTGIAAAALATRHWAGENAPNQYQVRVPGGVVGVRMFATEEGEHVSINGPAQLSFEGEIELAD